MFKAYPKNYGGVEVNSNIRCIEMMFSIAQNRIQYPVNSNIRCIEIIWGIKSTSPFEKVNSNIRCIEIIIQK